MYINRYIIPLNTRIKSYENHLIGNSILCIEWFSLENELKIAKLKNIEKIFLTKLLSIEWCDVNRMWLKYNMESL